VGDFDGSQLPDGWTHFPFPSNEPGTTLSGQVHDHILYNHDSSISISSTPPKVEMHYTQSVHDQMCLKYGGERKFDEISMIFRIKLCTNLAPNLYRKTRKIMSFKKCEKKSSSVNQKISEKKDSSSSSIFSHSFP
jgi:hypothetical protein